MKVKQNKGFIDGFTIADTTIQKTIEHNLRQLYPYVTIVGEEENENIADIKPTIEPDQLDRHLVSQTILADSYRKRKEKLKAYLDTEYGSGTGTLNEEEALIYNQEDLVFWIDPLDGTRGFWNGHTSQVTSIIGK